MHIHRITAAALLVAVAHGTQEATKPDAPHPNNVLLFVLDDVGRDKIGCYGVSPDAGPTPVIDGLAARGVRFRNAWATPFCSPTRAAIITGRHPSRTGIGAVVNFFARKPGLSADEWTIADAAKERAGARSAVIGKWHLAGAEQGLDHPRDSGFDHFAGTMRNLGRRTDPDAYFRSAWTQNGTPVPNDSYATTRAVDDALHAVLDFEQREAGDRAPWFVMVSFHAAHFPLHAPPPDLHSFELSGAPNREAREHHRAMVEAIDTEIGRMLASLDESVLERTTILVIGDNGTQNRCLGEAMRKGTGKGTMHEGGIGVPLIVTGAAVKSPGRTTDAFAHVVDLFPTIVELLGGRGELDPPSPIDGVSLVPVLTSEESDPPRMQLFAEWFEPNHAPPTGRVKWHRAIRRGDHKLILPMSEAPRLYDLAEDPFEERDLLTDPPEGADREAIRARVAELRGELDRLERNFAPPSEDDDEGD